MAEETTNRAAQRAEEFSRSEDFASEYSNNFQFEHSLFDLKLIFGQLDQSAGKIVVEQHTSMTLSWLSAKLLSYYLQLNIAFHEAQHGKINIPNEVLPPPVTPLSEEQQNDPRAQEFLKSMQGLREQFVSGGG